MYNCLLYLQGMKMFFLIVVAVYILYLIFLVVRARSELKNMPYSGKWCLMCLCSQSTPSTLVTLLCCVFSIARSPAKVFDSADICGPCYKVCFKKNTNPKTSHSAFLGLIWSFCSSRPLFSSMVILYLRFGAKALQDNFDAELSTNYQNYILFKKREPGFYLNVGLHVAFAACIHVFLSSRHTSWIFIILRPSQPLLVHISLCVFSFQECPLR